MGSDFGVERANHVLHVDPEAGSVLEQPADQLLRVGRPLLLAQEAGDFLDERALPMSDLDEAVDGEVSVRLHHRGRVHAQLPRERPHRRQGVARLQLAGRHGHTHTRGDLLVEGRRAAGIDLGEQGELPGEMEVSQCID